MCLDYVRAPCRLTPQRCICATQIAGFAIIIAVFLAILQVGINCEQATHRRPWAHVGPAGLGRETISRMPRESAPPRFLVFELPLKEHFLRNVLYNTVANWRTFALKVTK